MHALHNLRGGYYFSCDTLFHMLLHEVIFAADHTYSLVGVSPPTGSKSAGTSCCTSLQI